MRDQQQVDQILGGKASSHCQWHTLLWVTELTNLACDPTGRKKDEERERDNGERADRAGGLHALDAGPFGGGQQVVEVPNPVYRQGRSRKS